MKHFMAIALLLAAVAAKPVGADGLPRLMSEFSPLGLTERLVFKQDVKDGLTEGLVYRNSAEPAKLLYRFTSLIGLGNMDSTIEKRVLFVVSADNSNDDEIPDLRLDSLYMVDGVNGRIVKIANVTAYVWTSSDAKYTIYNDVKYDLRHYSDLDERGEPPARFRIISNFDLSVLTEFTVNGSPISDPGHEYFDWDQSANEFSFFVVRHDGYWERYAVSVATQKVRLVSVSDKPEWGP